MAKRREAPPCIPLHCVTGHVVVKGDDVEFVFIQHHGDFLEQIRICDENRDQ